MDISLIKRQILIQFDILEMYLYKNITFLRCYEKKIWILNTPTIIIKYTF